MASMLKKTEGIEQSRRRQRFNAHSNSYSSANSQRIRIDINSSEEYIDFANSALVFDLAVTGGAGNVTLVRYGASSWVKEVRVKSRSGDMIGENIQDYAVLSRLLFEMNVGKDAETSYLDVTEGATARTDGAATLTSKQYAHQFVTGILSNKNYMPIHVLGGISIEIDMHNASEVVMEAGTATGAGTAVYTIQNLAFVADLIRLKPEVESLVLNQVSNGGLVIDYNTHHCVKGTIAANSSNRFDLGTMNGRVSNLQAVQVIAKASQAVDQFDTFSKNNTSAYRWKLGSKYLSESPVSCTGANKEAEQMFEWLKSQKALCLKDMGRFGNQDNTRAQLAANKFVIGQGADRSQSNQVLSSLKDKDHNRLELELDYSPNAAVGTLYVFAELNKRVRLFPGKQFQDDDFSGQGTNMQ